MPSSPAPRRSRPRSDNSGYVQPETKSSLADGIAHYLDWAAVKRPYQFLPYPEIAQQAMGLTRLPRINTDETKMAKNAMSRARKILFTKYNRATVSKIGSGVRATVDDADMAKYVLTAKVKSLANAGNKVVETIDAIDPKKMSSAGEEGLYKRFVEEKAAKLRGMITSNSYRQLLLPPAEPEKKE